MTVKILLNTALLFSDMELEILLGWSMGQGTVSWKSQMLWEITLEFIHFNVAEKSRAGQAFGNS